MLIRRLGECPEFQAGDTSLLREIANAATGQHAFRYSLAYATVIPGRKTVPHALRTSEAYYILQGCGRMHIGGESADVGPGCFIEIPPAATQWIENTGTSDLRFLCIVDPAWRKADETICNKTDSNKNDA